MGFGESKEFPGSAEGTVEFDKETCCVLERGINQNPEVVQRLKEIIGSVEVDNFLEILSNTNEMKFVPSEEMKTVYGQIAKRELERIEAEDEDDRDLTCGHTVNEHTQALQRVVDKMSATVN